MFLAGEAASPCPIDLQRCGSASSMSHWFLRIHCANDKRRRSSGMSGVAPRVPHGRHSHLGNGRRRGLRDQRRPVALRRRVVRRHVPSSPGWGWRAGLHRYFTHRSFVASEPVKVFLAVAGSMAAQGPVIFWVANHRLHHAFADTDRDPHSPRPQGTRLLGRVKGLWHGHIGWLFTVNKIDWSRHTRDWLADRRVMTINGHYFSLVLARHRHSGSRRRSC